MVQILQLDTGRRQDAQRFVQVPFDLYRDSPYWVPPLVADALNQVNPRRNPYFLHSEAAFFLAMEGREAVGRIAVMENRNYNSYHHARHGFFYLFDTIDDPAVSDALYGAAMEWCRARGLAKLVGPKGFVVFDGIGMLQKGFDHLPAMGIPYNYAYYNRLTELSGFEKEVDFHSLYLSVAGFKMPERVAELAQKVQQRRGLRAMNFSSAAELKRRIPEIVEAYNSTFTENWEYMPVTPQEAKAVAGQMLQITRPDMIKVIVNEEGQIVGFLTAFLNVGKALQRCRGRLFPLGWYYLLREMKRTTWVDLNGMGILERYRGLGGNAILYNELHKSLSSGQFVEGEMVQMADSVVRMLSDAHTLGGEPYKVHRVYRRSL